MIKKWNSTESSQKYRDRLKDEGYVGLTKYVPGEMRGYLHQVIDSELKKFHSGKIPKEKLI